jgi:ribosomal protein L4
MPKKVRRLASASALSQASKDAKIYYVSSFDFLKEAKTKVAYEYFSKLAVTEQKVLVLADWRLPENAQLKLSVRNLPFVRLSLPDSFSVKDVVEADVVIVTDDALASLDKRLLA